MSKNCNFSCSNGLKSFKDNRTASILFIIYCIVIVIYGGYCLYLNSNKFLNNELQLILMAVGICLLLILFGILMKWLIKNMWIKLIVLERILPITRTRA
jgi:intracellular septation protein A